MTVKQKNDEDTVVKVVSEQRLSSNAKKHSEARRRVMSHSGESSCKYR